jgi:hypothetical protein
MKRVIEYTYRTFDIGCGCCSDSSSEYDLFEDCQIISWGNQCGYCSDEKDLRSELSHLEPFEISKDSTYY